mmetsp:Transcript_96779/g.208835  ORF Transcript_96779/g.208835 Transcript_96779/m.208835 type:complete len:150 (+) Transcript_96779:1093-1542(+)|eukprot:CAMPEP_0116903014 /NCGR_PEP_ID=MMETSP0467-20121206/10457_1 /TAXON_ID=283647 /ORGANISM="Mesodinium pulex, Strain SPMC105" /LENGTH=149 /DNA_ID=CAMNT_0004577159 /DNA_START=1023 /DNA_END=1472 /DNA_ORIENTATION=-
MRLFLTFCYKSSKEDDIEDLVKVTISKLDIKQRNSISYTDFACVVQNIPNDVLLDRLKKLFKVIDTDKGGTLSLKEILEFLKDLNMETELRDEYERNMGSAEYELTEADFVEMFVNGKDCNCLRCKPKPTEDTDLFRKDEKINLKGNID